jgi:DNA repair exonuclease SbcCD ATPase subunit
VIQELGARGRTVGIVTHVRELAEQVPVRFEVRKEFGTATVERVEL